MYEFLQIAGAIFAANIALVMAGLIFITNKRIVKWYAKKTVEMSKTIVAEVEKLEEKDWES